MPLRGFEIVSSYKEHSIILPERKTIGSAGYDLAAAESVTVLPQQVCLVPTGLKAYMQQDEYLGVHIRSSIAVQQLISLVNGQGIVDSDYYNNPSNEGHILIALINHGPLPVYISAGTRIAQGIFYKYLVADPGDTQTPQLRHGGFGSTGN